MKFDITPGPWFLSFKNPHKVCFQPIEGCIKETQTVCIIHTENVHDTVAVSYLPNLLDIIQTCYAFLIKCKEQEEAIELTEHIEEIHSLILDDIDKLKLVIHCNT